MLGPSSQFCERRIIYVAAQCPVECTRFEGSSCTSRFGAQVCPAASCFASCVYCDASFRCAYNARQGPLGLRCPAPHARAQWYVLSVWRGSSSHHTLLILTFVSYVAQGSLRAPTRRAAHAAQLAWALRLSAKIKLQRLAGAGRRLLRRQRLRRILLRRVFFRRCFRACGRDLCGGLPVASFLLFFQRTNVDFPPG